MGEFNQPIGQFTYIPTTPTEAYYETESATDDEHKPAIQFSYKVCYRTLQNSIHLRTLSNVCRNAYCLELEDH